MRINSPSSKFLFELRNINYHPPPATLPEKSPKIVVISAALDANDGDCVANGLLIPQIMSKKLPCQEYRFQSNSLTRKDSVMEINKSAASPSIERLKKRELHAFHAANNTQRRRTLPIGGLMLCANSNYFLSNICSVGELSVQRA